MDTLRDNRHEGWVLAAYPDPKTSRPLIGAGFSLDLPAREHAQHDPLNPNVFLEPSSAQLWEAAGLPPQQLQTMLQQFNYELDAWNKKKFRQQDSHATSCSRKCRKRMPTSYCASMPFRPSTMRAPTAATSTS